MMYYFFVLKIINIKKILSITIEYKSNETMYGTHYTSYLKLNDGPSISAYIKDIDGINMDLHFGIVYYSFENIVKYGIEHELYNYYKIIELLYQDNNISFKEIDFRKYAMLK